MMSMSMSLLILNANVLRLGGDRLQRGSGTSKSLQSRLESITATIKIKNNNRRIILFGYS